MLPLILACATPGTEATAAECGDGFDNDGDALHDCQDPDCAAWCAGSSDSGDSGGDTGRVDPDELDMSRFWPAHKATSLRYDGDDGEAELEISSTADGFADYNFRDESGFVMGFTLKYDDEAIFLWSIAEPDQTVPMSTPLFFAPNEIETGAAWEDENAEGALFAFVEFVGTCEAFDGAEGDCVFHVLEGDGAVAPLAGEWLLMADVGPAFIQLHTVGGNYELVDMDGTTTN